jgi:hypothetical protein
MIKSRYEIHLTKENQAANRTAQHARIVHCSTLLYMLHALYMVANLAYTGLGRYCLAVQFLRQLVMMYSGERDLKDGNYLEP